MIKTTTNLEEMRKFKADGEEYLRSYPPDELAYPLIRTIKFVTSGIAAAEKEIIKSEISHAEKHKDSKLLMADRNGQFVFSNEGRSMLTDEVYEITHKDREVSVYRAKRIPPMLSPHFIISFTPFIFEDMDEEQFVEQYLTPAREEREKQRLQFLAEQEAMRQRRG